MERAGPRRSFDSYLQDEVECVASHFLVVGLQPGPLQPLLPVEQGCDDVLTGVCVVLPSKGEECPPGYTLIESTPDGQRASLNHGAGARPLTQLAGGHHQGCQQTQPVARAAPRRPSLGASRLRQACGPRPRESRAGATQRLAAGHAAEPSTLASVRAGDVLGAPVFLAVCTEPITQCRASRRPITAVQAIHVDRGEKAAPGFTPITSTVGGHEANLNYGGAGRLYPYPYAYPYPYPYPYPLPLPPTPTPTPDSNSDPSSNPHPYP